MMALSAIWSCDLPAFAEELDSISKCFSQGIIRKIWEKLFIAHLCVNADPSVKWSSYVCIKFLEHNLKMWGFVILYDNTCFQNAPVVWQVPLVGEDGIKQHGLAVYIEPNRCLIGDESGKGMSFIFKM